MIHNEMGTVLSKEEIAENIFQAVIHSPKISNDSKAGQFINILPDLKWPNVMRRPMSIASQDNGKISIIYKVFGYGTELISNWRKNQKVDIIGPLGNWWNDYEEKVPVLIGGGVGIAPIINLHNDLISKSIEHYLIMGARTKSEHFISHAPENNIYLATDLDNYGVKGNVINAFENFYEKLDKAKIKIFSCGPPGMMNAVKNYSIEKNISCDLALETIMACGVGICQGCTVTLENNSNEASYREKFALACLDGPIFNAKDIDNACFIH